MPYETEYDKLKENIREWRESGHNSLPSFKRILDAAEQTLNRMPQPVRGWIVAWPTRRVDGSPIVQVSHTVYDTEQAAKDVRLDYSRWSSGEPVVVELVCEYKPPRAL